MFTEGNVLSWATFFPLIGAGLIVVLLAAKYAAKLSKQTTDQAARWMRHLFDKPQQRARLGAAARKTIVEEFNNEVAGAKMRQRLYEIYQQRGKLPA